MNAVYAVYAALDDWIDAHFAAGLPPPLPVADWKTNLPATIR